MAPWLAKKVSAISLSLYFATRYFYKSAWNKISNGCLSQSDQGKCLKIYLTDE